MLRPFLFFFRLRQKNGPIDRRRYDRYDIYSNIERVPLHELYTDDYGETITADSIGVSLFVLPSVRVFFFFFENVANQGGGKIKKQEKKDNTSKRNKYYKDIIGIFVNIRKRSDGNK